MDYDIWKLHHESFMKGKLKSWKVSWENCVTQVELIKSFTLVLVKVFMQIKLDLLKFQNSYTLLKLCRRFILKRIRLINQAVSFSRSYWSILSFCLLALALFLVATHPWSIKTIRELNNNFTPSLTLSAV